MSDSSPDTEISAKPPASNRLKHLALLVLPVLFAWSPALVTGSLMEHYAVNIPTWDDFERAELIARYHEGTLDWDYLVSPHIEHRILVPRLITLANCAFGSGDLRNEIWVSFAAMLTISICLARLILKIRGRRPGSWFLIFLCNLCVFSLLQYQNLLWAVQTAFFLPLAFLCLALLALHSDLKLPVRFAIALLCAVGATFSFSHGLIVWPAVLGYLLLSPATGTPRTRAVVVTLWALLAAADFVFYFHDLSSTSHSDHSYGQAAGEPSFGVQALKDHEVKPEVVGESFLTGIGSHFSRFVFYNPTHVAPKMGLFLVSLFFTLAATGLAICLRRKSGREWENLLPWLVLGGYALAAVFAIAMGRSHFAVYRTLSPRYLTASLYLTVALIVLFPMVASLLTGKNGRHGPAIRQAGLVAGVFFVALQGWNWLYGYHALKAWHASRWQSVMALSFRDYGEIQHPYRIDFDPGFPRQQVDRLKQFGYFDNLPDPFRPGDFARFQISKKVLPDHKAGIGSAAYQRARTEQRVDGRGEPYEKVIEEGWRIEGFADIRTKMGRVPDGIVFTLRDEPVRTIAGFGEVHPQLPFHISDWDFEFARLNNQTLESRTAWTAHLRLSDLPEDTAFPATLDAWAIDFEAKRVYRIGEPVILVAPGCR